jgi:two-component system, CitB family, sensor kinase
VCRRRALRQCPVDASAAVTNELADGQLQRIVSEVQKRTDVLFVVITNNQGIRLDRPIRDELGRHVSTDPAEALVGHEVVLRQSGTL